MGDQPAPQASGVSDDSSQTSWITSLRERFERLLVAEKPNRYSISSIESGRSTARSSLSVARSSVPTPPQDPTSFAFAKLLHTLSTTPLQYEDSNLLDKALSTIPLDRIYLEAEEESQKYKSLAQSEGEEKTPEWGYQDCVIKALLRWFRRDFFNWLSSPPCPRCASSTVDKGMTPPMPAESAEGAKRVVLYQCSVPTCGAYERFPRYNDVLTLLRTRKGRCGEYANCFTFLCRAMGARVRWIWNAEDHVWTEVFSEKQQRWVHVDSCEEAWDEPKIYAEGWGKKMSYCLAFSSEGATDVTRRYVRNAAKHGLARTRAPEGVLRWVFDEICRLRREEMSGEERAQLQREDEREEQELQGHVAEAVAADLISLVPNAVLIDNPTEHREDPLPGRQSGSPEWVRARGEDGKGPPQ
ncbi:MAG: peptide-N4-(N-acetyl-beta- glucosaminyl)asparagine amidase [Caeruleum heppii]|nr:MAG: peptide-N4-(N-acetyl-beta- glucosaminyl)asparagine amidase [Caeruleum heppii]